MTDMTSLVSRPLVGRIVAEQGAKIAVVALLIVVMVSGSMVSSRFATPQNFVNVLEQSVVVGLVALGQTLVILIGGIDLSIGALVGGCTVALAGLINGQDERAVPVLLGVLLLGALVGLVNGLLITRLRLHALIITIGTAAVINGATLLYTLHPVGSVPEWLGDIGYDRVFGMPIGGIVLVALYAAAWLYLSRFRGGPHFYAVGDDPEVARLNGISTRRVTLLAYLLSGACASLAAIYLVCRTGVGDPLAGEALMLGSITPVLVGGTVLGGGRGGVVGTLLGTMLVAFLSNALNYMNVSTFVQWIVQGLIIAVAVSSFSRKEKRS